MGTKTDTAPRRRMGSQDSATAQSLLDATERVLQAHGYLGITSQSVAEEAGVKRQLVFYYFQNVDEMILTAFSRRMNATLAKIEQAGKSERPVHAIWDAYQNAFDARLIFEYTALANHNEAIRHVISEFVEKIRNKKVSIIKKAYRDKNIASDMIPPDVVAFLISCITMSLTREEGMGTSISHKSTRDTVRKFLDLLE